jgi:2-(1,2-epoxy-1,2-dihydrophenyl)acetyl-CoA isomerase
MTTQSDASVLLDGTEGVGWITLNRPEVYNALNTDMAERLLDAVIRCDEDDKIRAVVITGSGASFCAGGDIRQMIDSGASEGNAARFLKTLTVSLHAATATIAYMSKPVVMAVNGAAAGAGFSLALAGDLVLAADNARFTVAYTAIGLAPDGSSTFTLPRLVGPKRAFELMCTNRRYAKRLVTLSAQSSLETQMEHERRAIAACGRTADFREGTDAFIAKRPSEFQGR